MRETIFVKCGGNVSWCKMRVKVCTYDKRAGFEYASVNSITRAVHYRFSTFNLLYDGSNEFAVEKFVPMTLVQKYT